MSFAFRGQIPASKSILNRLLIVKSYFPDLEVYGNSDADDVVKLKAALANLDRVAELDCGAGGTTLRFLALRASRVPGRHVIRGTQRLFSRPQGEIVSLLEQLGCRGTLAQDHLIVEGDGWRVPEGGVRVDRGLSSQFASSLILNAWRLPERLKIQFTGDSLSEPYFKMTCSLVERLGMCIRAQDDGQLIEADARVTLSKIEAEADVSSAFAVAALAAASGGECVIENWPQPSLQADAVFVEILARMGCSVSISAGAVSVRGPTRLKAVHCDLGDAPDLFPVLSALCAIADGESILDGAPQLAHKESDRLSKSEELVRLMGAEVHRVQGGLSIRGTQKRTNFRFHPDHDHRMAMAAACARRAGYGVEIEDIDVVDKSFPGFWKIANDIHPKANQEAQ